jgi:myo-inositol catabolism protein IolS
MSVLKRKLGKTGLDVSVVGFGGASISGEGRGYGFGEIDSKSAKDLLLYTKDHGINLFDTAPIYGFGLSEQRIGEAFKSCRDEVIIVSKSGVTWDQNKRVDINNSRKSTLEMLDNSLKRIASDYIDIFLVHWPDPRHDIRHAFEVLAEAKEKGKVRFIGLCNTNIDEIKKAREISEIDVFQSEYSFFSRSCEKDLFPHISGAGFLGWGSFDKGIITGRVKKNRHYDESDARRSSPWWKKSEYEPKIDFIEGLDGIFKSHRRDGLDLALHFLQERPELSSALCGARSMRQIDSIVGSLGKDTDASFLSACNERYQRWVETSK